MDRYVTEPRTTDRAPAAGRPSCCLRPPRYHTASVALVADLPETFLAVAVFAHHLELTQQLFGTHTGTHDLHGEERLYFVHKHPAAKQSDFEMLVEP